MAPELMWVDIRSNSDVIPDRPDIPDWKLNPVWHDADLVEVKQPFSLIPQ